MLERAVESYLRDRVEANAGLCFKLESPGNAGMPDRVVIVPFGKVFFVETKRPGSTPECLQQYQHGRLRNRGIVVRVISSREQVDAFIDEVFT